MNFKSKVFLDYSLSSGTTEDILVNGASGEIKTITQASISGSQTPWTTKVDAATNYLYNIPTIRDASENEVFGFSSVASAVNYLEVANSATTDSPSLNAVGSDTDIGIVINTKGTGAASIFHIGHAGNNQLHHHNYTLGFQSSGGTSSAFSNSINVYNNSDTLYIKNSSGYGLAIAAGTVTSLSPAASGVDLELNGNSAGIVSFTDTSAIKIPAGTDAQRGTPAVGWIRWNTDGANYEGYNGTTWDDLSGGGGGGTILGSIGATSGLIPYGTGVANTVTSASTFYYNATELGIASRLYSNVTSSAIVSSRLRNYGTGGVSLDLHNSNVTSDTFISFSSSAATPQGRFNVGVDWVDSIKFKISSQSVGGVNTPSGGIDRLTIDTSGNVGIGTSSPNELLHINSSVSNSDTKLVIQANGDANDAHLAFSTPLSNSTTRKKVAIVAEGKGTWNRADLHFVLEGSAADVQYALGTDTKMIIQYSGNVGIGTVSPSELLHIKNPSGLGAFVRLEDTAGGGVYLGGRSENMELYAGGSEAIRVLANGNVGIGSTAPEELLTIGQFGGAAGTLRIQYSSSNIWTELDVNQLRALDSGNPSLLYFNHSGGNIAMIANTPNYGVGIGVQAPADRLDVFTTTYAPNIANTVSATYTNKGLVISGSGNRIINNGVGLTFRLSTSTTGSSPSYEQARIVGMHGNSATSNAAGAIVIQTRSGSSPYWHWNNVFFANQYGNVGIQNTSPAYRFDVNGSGRFTGDLVITKIIPPNPTTGVSIGTYGNFTFGTSANSTNTWNIYGNGGSPSIFSVAEDGDVRIYKDLVIGGNSAQQSGYYLTLRDAGGGYLSAYGLNWVASSDENLKKNIVPIKGVLATMVDFVKNSKYGVATYQWKDTGAESLGIVAQDVLSYFPQIVSGDGSENNAYGISYNQLASLNTKAICELKDEKDIEIEKLRNMLIKMENRIKLIEDGYNNN